VIKQMVNLISWNGIDERLNTIQ